MCIISRQDIFSKRNSSVNINSRNQTIYRNISDQNKLITMCLAKDLLISYKYIHIRNIIECINECILEYRLETLMLLLLWHNHFIRVKVSVNFIVLFKISRIANGALFG